MQRLTLTLLTAAIAGTANADTITQMVDFDYNANTGEIVTFQRFDDMGGTRQLTGMHFSYDQSIRMDMTIESNGYTALSAGDWSLDAGFNSLHQYGLVDDNPNAPFSGPGAIFDNITADLGVSDGYNQSGPDTYYATIADSFVYEFGFDGSNSISQTMFETFTGTEELDTYFNGFAELFFVWVNDPNWVVDPKNPPDGPFDGPFSEPYYGIFVTIDQILHSGTITLTYEYENVPAPSGLLALSGAGLIASRRRRR